MALTIKSTFMLGISIIFLLTLFGASLGPAMDSWSVGVPNNSSSIITTIWPFIPLAVLAIIVIYVVDEIKSG